MRTVGVIAEYDPFHLGHAYHLQQARQRTQADWVLCVMSGCFTQRGQGALLSPAQRARMALESGADVVLEAAGGKDTFALAWKCARPNGLVTVVALYEEAQAQIGRASCRERVYVLV